MTHVPLTIPSSMQCSGVQISLQASKWRAGTDESVGDAKIGFLDDVLDMH